MNRVKNYSIIFISLLALIMFHNNILVLISNVTTLFKKDNRVTLINKMYEEKIENLEKQLLSYENNLNNLKLYDSSSYILARIAFRDIYDFYNYLIITTDNPVKVDSAVINENGLVGFITSTGSGSAKVSLLTGTNKLSVRVRDSYGLIDGYDKKEKLLIIHNINNYETIEQGDIVYTSGLTDIQGDIEVGTTEKVIKKGLETIVYVKSSVNFDDLNYLYVLSK